MAQVRNERVTARIDGDFVVFLIGMRINRLWKVHKWLPVFLAMRPMLQELGRNPDSGFLGAEQAFISPRMPMLVQYWRSFDHLERYARARDAHHYPAWVAFNKKVASNGDVGIWHESLVVPAGGHESIYNNMPPFGLGRVAQLVPAVGARAAASGRLSSEQNGNGAYPAEAVLQSE